VIDEVKLWLRLRYSSAQAAIKALRHHGMDIHDDARADSKAGKEQHDSALTERGTEGREHADQVHDAATEIEQELERALTSTRNDPEKEHPPDDNAA